MSGHVRRCPDGTPVYVEDARQELEAEVRDLPLSSLESTIVHWLQQCDQPTMHAVAGLIRKARQESEARVAELKSEIRSKTLPCDGGCSPETGPQEDCSAHGRPVAEVWQALSKSATAYAELRRAVRELALKWDAEADAHSDKHPREARVGAADARELLALVEVGPAEPDRQVVGDFWPL